MPVLTLKKLLPYLVTILFGMLVSSCQIFRKPSEGKQIITKRQPETRIKESIQTKKLIQTARSYTGVPYKSGGNDSKGLDCSGLLCNTFIELGVKLPRISWQQAEYFPPINLQNIQKGDLVFFVTAGKNISHAGMVTEVKSENEIIFIHASSSKGVIEDNMMTNYWKSRFARVCRPQFNDLVKE
jgi:probable lipoprotein NlpC